MRLETPRSAQARTAVSGKPAIKPFFFARFADLILRPDSRPLYSGSSATRSFGAGGEIQAETISGLPQQARETRNTRELPWLRI